MIKEYFKISIKNLKTRPLRSWLTILGIVMGIFLIISLLSLTEGLKSAVMDELRMMGSELIVIFPGDMSDMITAFIGGMTLSDNDISAIGRARGVDKVIPMLWAADTARHREESKTILLTGVPFDEGIPLFEEDMGWSITEGRWPIPGRREIIVGSIVPREIFPKMEVGDRINIGGKPFEVVGFLRSLGNKQDDSMMHLDLNDFKSVTGRREGAQTAFARVSSGYLVDEVAKNIEAELEQTRRRVSGDTSSFSVITSEKASDMVENIMGLIQLAVFAFASIALIVGGIGIMNTMYTSVYERTKEIGILKAIGAKRRAITYIFLIESGVIGLIGGIGGVLLGIIIAKSIEIFGQVHPMFYIEASISSFLIIFGLTFSFIVGCLSGFFPAKRAASYKPVDALRYE